MPSWFEDETRHVVVMLRTGGGEQDAGLVQCCR